jgi:hypothetical protein
MWERNCPVHHVPYRLELPQICKYVYRFTLERKRPVRSVKNNFNPTVIKETFRAVFLSFVHKKKIGRLEEPKEHRQIYTVENPYSCVVCANLFDVSQYLKINLLVHSENLYSDSLVDIK